jgi:hypothetical protein
MTATEVNDDNTNGKLTTIVQQQHQGADLPEMDEHCNAAQFQKFHNTDRNTRTRSLSPYY